mmetsp:Transcript_52159/g.113045  ORF Transcript_52159/g.113045 Transcript_52159/m.113045 type:complete len:83 (+) Transcript_52159:201-449(+)
MEAPPPHQCCGTMPIAAASPEMERSAQRLSQGDVLQSDALQSDALQGDVLENSASGTETGTFPAEEDQPKSASAGPMNQPPS